MHTVPGIEYYKHIKILLLFVSTLGYPYHFILWDGLELGTWYYAKNNKEH